jgi:hypothetical protein
MLQFSMTFFINFFLLARQFKYINEHELLQMKQEDGSFYNLNYFITEIF